MTENSLKNGASVDSAQVNAGEAEHAATIGQLLDIQGLPQDVEMIRNGL